MQLRDFTNPLSLKETQSSELRCRSTDAHLAVFLQPSQRPPQRIIIDFILWFQVLWYDKETITGQVSRSIEHRQQSRDSQGPFWTRWGSCYQGQIFCIILGFWTQKTMPPVYETQPVLLLLALHLSPPLICSSIHWQRRRNVNERLWEPEGKIWDVIGVQRKWYLAKSNVE